MAKSIKRVAVTGGAGHLAYGLLFRIAAGEMLGEDEPLALHILEIPEALPALEGVRMELEDCAFPLLKEIRVGTDAEEMFGDVDFALLVGAKPRGPGMERKDLLFDNGKIFVGQGRALNAAAARDCKVLVVGNPCNTNCLIAMNNAPDLPRKNFHAMTRLDQNRAAAQLANKASVDVSQVSRVTIWGNHSATQVPDFTHALIGDVPAIEAITDRKWLEGEFITTVQGRGSAVIKARGQSSAASAANAALGAVKSLVTPTPQGQWFSSAVCTDGNRYGIDENLIFSMPCRSIGDGGYEIVSDLDMGPWLEERLEATEKELQEERALVEELCAVR